MEKLTYKQVVNGIQRWFFITLGLAIFAFAWCAFLLPSQLMGGGVSGIASLLYFALKIPVGISTMVINVLLVVTAYRILGFKFSLNTIICTVIVSAFFAIFQSMFVNPIVDDKLLCALAGSMISGVGIGIAINYGGNTGGTDIIILVINQFRNVSYGRMSLLMNVIIIGCSYFIVQSVDCLIYSYVAMVGTSAVSDMVIEGYRQTYQMMVFSKKTEEISERINQELHRGATLLKGQGSYTKEEKEVLLVIAHREDKHHIIRIIKEVDDSAFVSIAKTSGVFGKNFDRLRL
ncbi:MAG: YitT family protein [Bacteroidales bacterium]|nr:YitT family protein [Bacteroidales bacterium]